jgi:ubiquinone/menaquinone biosynthesis C-methylase UbiE
MKFTSELTYDSAAIIQDLTWEHLTSLFESSPPSHIIDFGCGTGKRCRALSMHYPHSNITGIDHSESMIAYAKKHHSGENIEYKCREMTHFTPPTPADCVISNAMIQWARSPQQALRHIHQCTSEIGTVYTSFFGNKTYRELRHVFDYLGLPIPLAADAFLGSESVMSIFDTFRSDYYFEQGEYTLVFDSFMDLLTHIKQVGSRSYSGYAPFFTPGIIKNCNDGFRSLYGQVRLTYHAFFYKSTP